MSFWSAQKILEVDSQLFTSQWDTEGVRDVEAVSSKQSEATACFDIWFICYKLFVFCAVVHIRLIQWKETSV